MRYRYTIVWHEYVSLKKMKICSGNTNNMRSIHLSIHWYNFWANPSDDTIALRTCHVDEEYIGQLASVEAAEAVLHVEEGGPAPRSQVQNIAEVQGPVRFLLHPTSVAILIFRNVVRINKVRRPCWTLYWLHGLPASWVQYGWIGSWVITTCVDGHSSLMEFSMEG